MSDKVSIQGKAPGYASPNEKQRFGKFKKGAPRLTRRNLAVNKLGGQYPSETRVDPKLLGGDSD
jgi:hypothetical protein